MAKRSSLATLSVAELEREIERRRRKAGRLLMRLRKQRARLEARLTALDAEIARHGGSVRGGGGGRGRRRVRPRNAMNLADSLVKLLKGTTMNVTKIADAVQRAGYKTTSPNFRTIVNQTLIKDPRIKRVGRGKYTAR